MGRKDPEARKAYLREYALRPEVIVARKAYMKARRIEERTKVIEHYGGKCACCGETEWKFLTIDHINGGGRQEKQEKGWSHIPAWYIIQQGFPTDLQVLCYNCNCAKGAWGRCPHEEGA